MSNYKKHIETTAVHGGSKPDPITDAIAPNIVLAKNGIFRGLEDPIGLEYSRTAHPNRTELENLISKLEGGGQTFSFASGISAIHCFFQTLEKGDHVIFGDKSDSSRKAGGLMSRAT